MILWGGGGGMGHAFRENCEILMIWKASSSVRKDKFSVKNIR